MRIVYVGGRMKLPVAAAAFDVDAARDGYFSADPQNAHEHCAALPDLARR